MSQYGSAGRRATARLRVCLATIAITACVLAGCAREAEHHEAAAVSAKAECRTERSRLDSLPEPDCEFRGVRQGTVDAEEFARLKLAYERQCYQRAERATRRQLQEMRARRTCEGKLASR